MLAEQPPEGERGVVEIADRRMAVPHDDRRWRRRRRGRTHRVRRRHARLDPAADLGAPEPEGPAGRTLDHRAAARLTVAAQPLEREADRRIANSSRINHQLRAIPHHIVITNPPIRHALRLTRCNVD